MGAEDFFNKVGEEPKKDVLESIINNLSKEEIAELIDGLKNKMAETNKYGEVSEEEMKNFDGTQYKTLDEGGYMDLRGLKSAEDVHLPENLDTK